MPLPLRTCAALLGLALCTAASAQLKPPKSLGPGPSTAPAAPAAPVTPAAPANSTNPANQEKDTAGRNAAAGWLTLLDRRDWGSAWENSAAMFRGSVPLANWMDAIPKVRADLGALVERTPVTTAYKDRLEGRPPGDYVSVVFASRFEKRQVEELVTTVREPDGRWRVTGYSMR